VLVALLLNAADAMQGAGAVLVRTARSGNEALLEVQDRGSGIAPQDIARLFEPFYTTKPPGRGTGLGLAICYGIVRDHGGRIEVESAVGRGSTFRVRLPLAPGAA
ncbi:MAG TPA: ATP-binding protein, partial [Gemmatimonadaceae bacterium]|nr:ATP-binding protein [Gemmatimonadaceae bacterium]